MASALDPDEITIDPQEFIKITKGLYKAIEEANRLPKIKGIDFGWHYCLVSFCGERVATDRLMRCYEIYEHLRNYHFVRAATEIPIKITWKVGKEAIENIHAKTLSEFGDNFIRILERKKSSNRLGCIVCLIDDCGFCKVVIQSEVLKESTKHRFDVHRSVDEKEVESLSITLIRKGPQNEEKDCDPNEAATSSSSLETKLTTFTTSDPKVLPAAIDIGSDLETFRILANKIHLVKQKVISGLIEYYADWEKLLKNGWFFCLISSCGRYSERLKVSYYGLHRHIQEKHKSLSVNQIKEMPVNIVWKRGTVSFDSALDVTHLLAKLIKGMSQHTRRLGPQESSNQLHWFICIFESCAVAKCVTEMNAENEFKNHLKDQHNIYPSYFRDEEKEFDQLSIILVVKCPDTTERVALKQIEQCGKCVCTFERIQNCQEHKIFLRTNAFSCGLCTIKLRGRTWKASTAYIHEWILNCPCGVSKHSETARSELQPSMDLHRIIIVQTHFQNITAHKTFDETNKAISHKKKECPLRHVTKPLRFWVGEGAFKLIVLCDTCSCQFKRILSCKEHNLYLKPYTFRCGQCCVQQVKKERKKILICRICDHDEQTKGAFEYHLCSYHNLLFDRIFYKCINCFKSFPDRNKLATHDC